MPVITVDDDCRVLERAWGLVTLPMAHPSHTTAVLDLFLDGQGGVCPRALQMFELAVEIAAMNGGTLQALLAAWTRSQFLAPQPPRRRADTIPGTIKAMRVA